MRRNHREKKENYISTLEQEVIRLRGVNAQQQNVKEIQAENQALRELLAVHGIASPPTTNPPTTSNTQEFVQISIAGDLGTGQRLVANPVQNSTTSQGQLDRPSSSAQPGPTSISMQSDTQRTDTVKMDLEAFDFVMRFVQAISVSRFNPLSICILTPDPDWNNPVWPTPIHRMDHRRLLVTFSLCSQPPWPMRPPKVRSIRAGRYPSEK